MILAPSILSADLAALGEAAGACALGGADRLHIDVMDGHFAPQLTFGLPIVRALKRASALPLDVHLMITNPDTSALAYAEAGAFQVTVHWEATLHLHRLTCALRDRGARVGVALNPATAETVLEQALDWIDHVLVMSVNPGFSGQTFIPQMLEKIARLRRRIDARGLAVEVGVDGGVTQDRIRGIAEAGAHACVAGSAIFDRQDPIQALRALRSAAETETV